MLELKKIETVICCRCKNPYPKRRFELGYKYCVNCAESVTKRQQCIVETVGTGDEVYTRYSVVSADEAKAFEQSRQSLRVSRKTLVAREPEESSQGFVEEEEVETTTTSNTPVEPLSVGEAFDDEFEEAMYSGDGQEEEGFEEEDILDVIARETCDNEDDEDLGI